MSKRKLILAAILGIILVVGSLIRISTSTTTAASTPEGVARENLAEWLNRIRSDYRSFGFKDERELDTATLGKPYQVYTLSPAALRDFQPGQRISSLVTQEQWWEFPIIVRGEPRGLLTVAQMNGQWRVVQLGELFLGQQAVGLQHRLANTQGNVKLVKFFPTNSTFALIERSDREFLTYLSSYPGLFKTIDRSNFTLYTPAVLMPHIQAAFAEVVEGSKAPPQPQN